MRAVAIGPFNRAQVDTLTSAAERSRVSVEVYESFEVARAELERDDTTPGCVLASSDSPLREIVAWIRARRGWYNLPVFALVPRPTESVFADAFAFGADDAIVDHDLIGIQRRLAAVGKVDPSARPPACEGRALVASANIAQRQSLGKVLRQAGFDVCYAGEASELLQAGGAAQPPTLVVATPSFPPMGGDAAVDTVRIAARNPKLPAIVVGARGPASTTGALQTAATRGEDVKGKLLFFAEEALRAGPAKDQRASKRLHFATICAFRMAGIMQPTYGLTHNISREGLFIRTIDPPPSGSDVWIEMRTFDDETVHLRGTVVWRRQLDQIGGTAPPGFGVRLDVSKSPTADMGRYVSSYRNLLRHQGAVN